MKALLVLSALVAVSLAAEVGLRSYDGYKVLTATTTTVEQFNVLKELMLADDYDFWTQPRLGGYTDIMTSGELLPQLIKSLEQAGMEWTVKIEDVGQSVKAEREENDAILRTSDSRMAWNAFQRFSVIEPWITGLPTQFPGLATVSVIGRSTEGRNVYMVKVSTGRAPGGGNKKVIFLDSNIHAREWIAGATGTWILNELLTNANTYKYILDELDFYFVPMFNVDGYEYSQTSDRMWRKTRSVNSGTTCRGCDPNRNFAFQWGGESTSTNPCSDLYMGSGPFSEPETRAVRDAIRAIQSEATIWAYITLHSYAQQWLLSWGYTQGVYPPDYPELLAWGRETIAALRAVHGTVYETGQGADLLYGVGGASDDYAKSEGIKYSTTAELRDTGRYGFLLPPAQIIPTGQETFVAVIKTAERVIAFTSGQSQE